MLRAWQSVRHVNGVAVYAEDEGADGAGGALMVSAVVRSSPSECFEVGGGRGQCCWGLPLCFLVPAARAGECSHADKQSCVRM